MRLKLAVLRDHVFERLIHEMLRRLRTKPTYWPIGVVAAHASRSLVLKYRFRGTSINGINESAWCLESGDLVAGDHALRRKRDLMRASRAKLV